MHWALIKKIGLVATLGVPLVLPLTKLLEEGFIEKKEEDEDGDLGIRVFGELSLS